MKFVECVDLWIGAQDTVNFSGSCGHFLSTDGDLKDCCDSSSHN